MKLQVLVATMNQRDHSILEKMNLQSKAIIVNQCDRNEFEELTFRGEQIRFLSLEERGVGLSRNTALMRATEDICIFADDDVTYVDGYEQIILDAFIENPMSDVILFNVPSKNPDRPTYTIGKSSRVRRYNCLRYGAVKIAFRTEKVRQKNLSFSLLFGGGAKYGSGEDSLFVADCVRKGLKVYTNSVVIGYVSQEESTWFKGYEEKFFRDKGAFFTCLSKKWAYILCIQLILRHRKFCSKDINIIKGCKYMFQGIREFK